MYCIFNFFSNSLAAILSLLLLSHSFVDKVDLAIYFRELLFTNGYSFSLFDVCNRSISGFSFFSTDKREIFFIRPISSSETKFFIYFFSIYWPSVSNLLLIWLLCRICQFEVCYRFRKVVLVTTGDGLEEIASLLYRELALPILNINFWF